MNMYMGNLHSVAFEIWKFQPWNFRIGYVGAFLWFSKN